MVLIVILFYPTWKLCIILYTKIVQDVYSWCIYKKYIAFRQTFVCILYTKSIQKFVQMWDAFYIQRFCIQKSVEIWDTFCMETFCIHFAYINSDVQKVYITSIMYTTCIQNLHRMYRQVIVCRTDCLFQHILTHLLCRFI